ncbi:MAG TPA: polyketide antibiotic transporter, partial [Nocardioides sp.]
GLGGWLTAHRDFGGGVLPARAGRPRAGRLLGTPLGLALRLQRGLLVGWCVGLAALGLLYGAVIPTIPDLVESNPDIAAMVGASADAEEALIDGFLRYIFLFMAVVSTAFVVTSVLRLRTEEEAGRAEMVLATGVDRSSLLTASATVAVLGALVLTVMMGLGIAVGYALGMGEWDRVAEHLGGQLAFLPGVLLVAACALALVGLHPRWSLLAWGVVAFVALHVMLGETLRLPDWVDSLSPFWHLPGIPVEPFSAAPAIVELVLASVLAAVGLWGFRRRDLTTG